jgi:hypothetical protein
MPTHPDWDILQVRLSSSFEVEVLVDALKDIHTLVLKHGGGAVSKPELMRISREKRDYLPEEWKGAGVSGFFF